MVGFLGRCAQVENHFVCGICGPNEKIWISDGLRGGSFIELDAKTALSLGKSSSRIEVESIFIVFIVSNQT